jgi:hypothetical protein
MENGQNSASLNNFHMMLRNFALPYSGAQGKIGKRANKKSAFWGTGNFHNNK